MKDGANTGPYPVFRLQEMLDDGKLRAGDLVWHDGMEAWQPLENADSLRTGLRIPGAAASPSSAEETLANDSTAVSDGEAKADLEATVERILRMTDAQAEHMMALRQTVAVRRFFARHIDYAMSLGILALVSLSGVLEPWVDLWDLPAPRLGAQVLAGALWVVLETALLATTGTTPGKWLMGMRVRLQAGAGIPPWLVCLRRSVVVWCLGAGLSLPVLLLVPVVQGAMAWRSWMRTGSTFWDHTCGTRVEFQPVSKRARVMLFVFVTAWLLLLYYLLLHSPRVKEDAAQDWSLTFSPP